MKQFKTFFASNHFWFFVIAFITLFTFVEFNNGKLWTNDFKVYYLATIDFFKGNDPYLHKYGLDTGYFKYPPFTLYLFKPFTLFSYGISQFIHLILLTLSLCFSFYLSLFFCLSCSLSFFSISLPISLTIRLSISYSLSLFVFSFAPSFSPSFYLNFSPSFSIFFCLYLFHYL